MNSDMIMDVMRNGFLVAIQVAAPLLISSLVVGLLVGVLQAATQVNDSSIGFVPKLVALGFVLIIAGPWMIDGLVQYLRESFSLFRAAARGE